MQVLKGGQGSYGNVDLERRVMGKSRKRVLFCFSSRLRLPRQTRGGPQFIASERITPRGGPRLPNPPRRATGFRQDTAFKQDYYALKSHCVPTIASRLALPNPLSRLLHRDLGVFKIITQ